MDETLSQILRKLYELDARCAQQAEVISKQAERIDELEKQWAAGDQASK